MSMSQAEIEAARYAARDRDFIATVGLSTQVEPMQIKTGKWRAYLRDFITPWSNHGQEAESREVVRDSYGYIVTEPSREQLVIRLRDEYPGWKWA